MILEDGHHVSEDEIRQHYRAVQTRYLKHS
jgi:hypothetical protein